MRGQKLRGQPAIQTPTLLDIAWAAGIYEGEGYCYVNTVPNISRGKWYVNTRHEVNVTQKDRWILDRLVVLFGGRVGKNITTFRHTEVFRWHIHGARARGFLMTVYKFLSPRRQTQARPVFNDLYRKEKT